MPTEVPIACSLTPEEMPDRMNGAKQLGRESLLDVSTLGRRAELRFKGDAQTREGIDAFIAAESKCCPFFSFEVSDEADSTVLAIEAPEDATWAVRGVVGGIVSGWEMPV